METRTTEPYQITPLPMYFYSKRFIAFLGLFIQAVCPQSALYSCQVIPLIGATIDSSTVTELTNIVIMVCFVPSKRINTQHRSYYDSQIEQQSSCENNSEFPHL